MGRSLNTVILSGYLGGQPRYHKFDNGDEVCNLSLAVNRSKKDPETGEYVDDALWVEVKVFGKQASTCDQWLTKGSFVMVQGQLAHPRLWQDENTGNQRVSLVVDQARVTFGPKTEGNGGQAHSAPQQAAPAAAQASSASKYGGDISF